MTQKPETSAAATNVPDVVGELDGGMFEHMLSVALSQTSAAVVDHGKTGEIVIKLKVEQIKGTHQVRMAHSLKFTKPTGLGKSSEEANGATVLFVGKFGALSIAQPPLFENERQTSIKG